MLSPAVTEAASRLCLACGMCCNGVLFHIVRLQPTDSVKALEKMGMKLSRKKTEPYFNQPCRFLQGCTCQVYEHRPTRCRLFECQQIHGLAAGQITEAEALIVIRQTQEAVARVERLLSERGNTATERPLMERFRETRQESGEPDLPLVEEMQRVNELLNQHFRTTPIPWWDS
ncbi:hypothetical protein SAMN02745166_04408 [Prosthecobacter debontii]|uniref:Uncharacterized protein n=1 Tax=Prosthecobacter debontii TaxID=48467 RepID=A0A1T4YW90_9BACT|nr:YkgJ family cysteine cluster protein [Prosthecobacter debontii]SKB06040.1 hypothetical protein SAMN02745166_04408 [Prosthecobacter debontii]